MALLDGAINSMTNCPNYSNRFEAAGECVIYIVKLCLLQEEIIVSVLYKFYINNENLKYKWKVIGITRRSLIQKYDCN